MRNALSEASVGRLTLFSFEKKKTVKVQASVCNLYKMIETWDCSLKNGTLVKDKQKGNDNV